ncbi:MAG: hypothetical protein ABIH35_01170 [Patescibacteria group bacterium]
MPERGPAIPKKPPPLIFLREGATGKDIAKNLSGQGCKALALEVLWKLGTRREVTREELDLIFNPESEPLILN